MLRRAEEPTSSAMREWRNQDANREVSVQQHVIDADEHQAWWDRDPQDDPSRRVLVFEYDGRALGIVNFFDLDLDGDAPTTGAWGFFLDHDTTTAEGTAMMAWMQVMKEATAYAFDEPRPGAALTRRGARGQRGGAADEPPLPLHRGRARDPRGRRPQRHRLPDLACAARTAAPPSEGVRER